MRRRAKVFLLVMVALNSLAFYFEPDVKTPLNAVGYGLFVVFLTFVFYKLALGEEPTE